MGHLAFPHGLKLGDFALVSQPGPVRGLARLVEFADHHGHRVRVEFPGQLTAAVLDAVGVSALEPPMSQSDAAKLLAALTAGDAPPDERPSDARYVTSIKTLSRGTWREMQQRLATLYAS